MNCRQEPRGYTKAPIPRNNKGMDMYDWQRFKETLTIANDKQLDVMLELIAEEDHKRQARADKEQGQLQEAKDMEGY